MKNTPAPRVFDEHEHEDALEPRHLIRRSDVVARAGILMLGAGTSGLRVRELMSAVAQTVGLKQIRAQVTFTDIVLTVQRRGAFRTQVAEISAPGVNAHRIAMLHNLALTLPERATVAEVDAMLDEVEHTPRLYPTWVLVLLTALACASVTVLNGGNWRELLAVLPASAAAFWLNRFLASRQLNHLAVVMASAAAATGLYLGFTTLLDLALGGSSDRMAAGLVCAAIFLIPGFPMVTAGLDLARIDLMAGVPRLAYAMMVLLALTMGAWVMISVTGVSPDPIPALVGPAWAVWVAYALASFFAVLGWAIMFNSPLPMALASGVIAVLGNLPRLWLIDAGVKPHIATFIACFFMGVLCAIAAGLFDMEKIIMTVPTLLVSIPGSAALRTLVSFDQADVVHALASGVETVLVAIAMVAGLAGARMLTDPEWAFTRPDPPTSGRAILRHLFGRRGAN